jgi:hypothetical protein
VNEEDLADARVDSGDAAQNPATLPEGHAGSTFALRDTERLEATGLELCDLGVRESACPVSLGSPQAPPIGEFVGDRERRIDPLDGCGDCTCILGHMVRLRFSRRRLPTPSLTAANGRQSSSSPALDVFVTGADYFGAMSGAAA